MQFSIDRTVHTTAFDKPVVDHWLERKIAQTAAGSTETFTSYPSTPFIYFQLPFCHISQYQTIYLQVSTTLFTSRHGGCDQLLGAENRLSPNGQTSNGINLCFVAAMSSLVGIVTVM